MHSTGQIPTAAEWEWGEGEQCPDYWQDDYEYYREKFLGQGVEAMIAYLNINPIDAKGALFCMPQIPFRYYVFAYKILLLGRERACDRFDELEVRWIADGFLWLLKMKLEVAPEAILPIMDELMPLAEYVAARQEFFGAGEEYFGSFPDKLCELKAQYEMQKAAKHR
jgi:hypothetical protein